MTDASSLGRVKSLVLKTERNFKSSVIKHLFGTLFFTAVFLALPLSASSQTVPRYDAKSYCQEVAAVSGGSAMIFNGCLGMEQDAYNALKSTWARLPANARGYCDEVASVTGGSYSILKGCIEMEVNASSSTPAFKY